MRSSALIRAVAHDFRLESPPEMLVADKKMEKKIRSYRFVGAHY